MVDMSSLYDKLNSNTGDLQDELSIIDIKTYKDNVDYDRNEIKNIDSIEEWVLLFDLNGEKVTASYSPVSDDFLNVSEDRVKFEEISTESLVSIKRAIIERVVYQNNIINTGHKEVPLLSFTRKDKTVNSKLKEMGRKIETDLEKNKNSIYDNIEKEYDWNRGIEDEIGSFLKPEVENIHVCVTKKRTFTVYYSKKTVEDLKVLDLGSVSYEYDGEDMRDQEDFVNVLELNVSFKYGDFSFEWIRGEISTFMEEDILEKREINGKYYMIVPTISSWEEPSLIVLSGNPGDNRLTREDFVIGENPSLEEINLMDYVS